MDAIKSLVFLAACGYVALFFLALFGLYHEPVDPFLFGGAVATIFIVGLTSGRGKNDNR